MPRQIPGFYFDDEKNTYFRIGSYHQSVPINNSSVKTKNLNSSVHKYLAHKREKLFGSFSHLLLTRETGQVQRGVCEREFLYNRTVSLCDCTRESKKQQTSVHHILVQKNKSGNIQLLCMLSNSRDVSVRKVAHLDALYDVKFSFISSYVNSYSITPGTDRGSDPSGFYIFCTGKSYNKDNLHCVHIHGSEDPGISISQPLYSADNILCIASSRSSIVAWVNTSRHEQNALFTLDYYHQRGYNWYHKVRSSPFTENVGNATCVEFSNSDNQIIVTGTKYGNILGYDLRCVSCSSRFWTTHSKCVTSVCPVSGGSRVVSKDAAGCVSLWDWRWPKRPVTHYLTEDGEKNGGGSLKRKVMVAEHEKLVYTDGECGFIRFWSLETGHLIRTITPDEHELGKDVGAMYLGNEDSYKLANTIILHNYNSMKISSKNTLMNKVRW